MLAPRAKRQHVGRERHLERAQLARALALTPTSAAVGRRERVGERLRVEACRRANRASLDENEAIAERCDRRFDAIDELLPSLHRGAQLDQIVGAGNGDDERALLLEDSPHLRPVAPAEERQRDVDHAVAERQPSIRVGHDPGRRRKRARRAADRCRRQVDPAQLERQSFDDARDERAVAAAEIDDGRRARAHELAKRPPQLADQRLGEPGIDRASSRGERFARVARRPRPSILRLKQVPVALTRAVERVSAWTDERAALVLDEPLRAAAYGAAQHPGYIARVVPPIVWESAHVLAVDKPCGMLTIPGRLGQRDPRPCLVQLLARDVPGKIWIVHRLDVETSGLVLFARTAAAHRALCLAFEERRVRKTYDAWTEGEPPAPIDGPLVWESGLKRGKRRAYEDPRGKWSQTIARCLGRIDHGDLRLLAWHLEPRTGRPHQLRVQAAARGWPIAGDRLYGSRIDLGPERIALRAIALDLGELGAPLRSELGLPIRLEVPALA
jgi:tRNA pseudouridine32 synthase / 23S rRNA pseudouridine746 synthase